VKTALVTGANKGIGYETARQLAAKAFTFFSAREMRLPEGRPRTHWQRRGPRRPYCNSIFPI
jgi:NAD(P)-dependent dehydrogenase (short-subunit alcohol dehydrogenase family)